jgi:ADP-L-glycero-D-manno-heptose 6-epimerase
MIIVTGAAGFIGSYLTSALNKAGYSDLVLVDEFGRQAKLANIEGKKFVKCINREEFPAWLERNHSQCDFIFHLGARTDTTEFDERIFNHLNLEYSKRIWAICTQHTIPMVYASSAATYGGGEHGYLDNHSLIPMLKPLNPYGVSKQQFDEWVLKQTGTPPFWAGLKFFNVFGPNEYHKARMASVVYHSYQQIRKEGKVRLFRSHKPEYKDGMQLRDFVYVKDVASVLLFMMESRVGSGIYNLGSGHARPFLHLAHAVFHALSLPVQIEFVDTPADIRDKYQYFTEAKMEKLRKAAYNHPFCPLEEAVADYVKNYLVKGLYF